MDTINVNTCTEDDSIDHPPMKADCLVSEQNAARSQSPVRCFKCRFCSKDEKYCGCSKTIKKMLSDGDSTQIVGETSVRFDISAKKKNSDDNQSTEALVTKDAPSCDHSKEDTTQMPPTDFICAISRDNNEPTNNLDIATHYTSLHCKRRPPFKCPVCTKGFSTKIQLCRHLRLDLTCVKNLNHQGKLKCPECPQEFSKQCYPKIRIRRRNIWKEQLSNVTKSFVEEQISLEATYLTEKLDEIPENVNNEQVQPVCDENTCEEPSSEFGSTINKDSNDDLSTLNIIKETLSDELDISVDSDFLNETPLDQPTPDSPKNIEKQPTTVGIDSTDKEKISEDNDSTMKPMETQKESLYIRRMFIRSEFVDSKCNEGQTKYKYMCTVCSKILYSSNGMYKHRKKHLKIKERQCHICNHQFAFNYELKRHLKVVHPGNQTSDNSANISDDNNSSKPLNGDKVSLDHEEPFPRYQCAVPLCEENFVYHRDIMNHYTNQHDLGKTPYMCPVCGKIDSKNASEHVKSHIRAAIEYRCRECSTVCGSWDTLKAHMQLHTDKWYKCSQCYRKFKWQSNLKSHMRTHIKKYTCNICSKEFFTQNGLCSHLKSHMVIKELQCKCCGKQFSVKSKLEKHLTTGSCYRKPTCMKFVTGDDVSKETRCFEDKEDETPKASDDQPVGGLIITNEPLLGFGNSATQEKSTVASAGEPVFQQPKQSSGLESWNELPAGLGIEIVEKEKPDDNETICSESSLDDSIVMNELLCGTRFPCAVPQCEEIFLYRQELIDHYISQHNMASVPFTCSVCNDVVENNIQVLKHINSHVKKSVVDQRSVKTTYLTEKLDEIPQKVNNQQYNTTRNTCEEPSSEFGSTINKDLNDDPSTCDELDISVDGDFMNEPPSAQPTHDSSMCIGKQPTTAGNPPSKNSEPFPDYKDMFIRSAFVDSKCSEGQQKYKYKCTVCSKILYSRNGIYKHRKQHLNIKELQCNVCNHQFAFNSDLKRHLKLVHPEYHSANISDDNNSSKPPNSEPFTRYQCAVPQCEENFLYHRDIMKHYINQHDLGKTPYMCPVCGKIDSKNVSEHVKSHIQVAIEYKCPKCSTVCGSSDAFRRHIMQVHTDELLYKCPQCAKQFKWQYSLARHISTHSRKYKCTICSKEFSTRNILRSHLKSHINELQCTDCGKQFPVKSKLKRHLNRENSCYRMPTCMKSAVEDQRSIKTTHLKEKLNEISKKVNNQQVQPVCDQSTSKEPSSEIGSTINKDLNFDLSTLNINEPLSDELDISIEGDFMNEPSLDQLAHDSSKNIGKQPTTVGIDSIDKEKTSDDNDSTMKPMTTHKHSENRSNRKPKNSELYPDYTEMFIRSVFVDSNCSEGQTKYKYMCTVCSKILYSRNGMYKHRKKHLNIREFQCNICNHQFGYNWELNRHHEHAHSGNQTSKNSVKKSDDNNSSKPLNGDKVSLHHKEPFTRYQCAVPQCEENFMHYRDTMKHYINQHDLGKTPYMCPVCGKIDSKNVSEHVKSHIRAAIEYKCPKCATVFDSSDTLKKHIMQVHTDEWLYKCPQCAKQFQWQCNLRKHIRTHCRRRHKCYICNKRFSTKNSLRSHLKSHMLIK